MPFIKIETNNVFTFNETDIIILRPQKIDRKYEAIKYVNYKNSSINYDIALIKTAKPIEFVMKDNKFILNGICLSKTNSEQFGEAIISDWEIDLLEKRKIYSNNYLKKEIEKI